MRGVVLDGAAAEAAAAEVEVATANGRCGAGVMTSAGGRVLNELNTLVMLRTRSNSWFSASEVASQRFFQSPSARAAERDM